MYDDHMYCDTCGKHSVACYCFIYNPPDTEEAERVCVEHDPIHGGPLTSLPSALWDTSGILPPKS